MECPICLEVIINKCTLICGHEGCHDCLEKWLSIKRNCPMCRQPVTAQFMEEHQLIMRRVIVENVDDTVDLDIDELLNQM